MTQVCIKLPGDEFKFRYMVSGCDTVTYIRSYKNEPSFTDFKKYNVPEENNAEHVLYSKSILNFHGEYFNGKLEKIHVLNGHIDGRDVIKTGDVTVWSAGTMDQTYGERVYLKLLVPKEAKRKNDSVGRSIVEYVRVIDIIDTCNTSRPYESARNKSGNFLNVNGYLKFSVGQTVRAEKYDDVNCGIRVRMNKEQCDIDFN